MSVCPSVCLSVCLTVCLAVSLAFYLTISFTVCLCDSLYRQVHTGRFLARIPPKNTRGKILAVGGIRANSAYVQTRGTAQQRKQKFAESDRSKQRNRNFPAEDRPLRLTSMRIDPLPLFVLTCSYQLRQRSRLSLSLYRCYYGRYCFSRTRRVP